jgi:predicted unusual protein kinase regulating ubiquinone biosynthesis (AarF/ABC1/UbiB family)
MDAELLQRLREELDCRREAASMRLYGRILKDEGQLHLPESVAALSTDRLLTMTWLAG